MIIGLDIDDVIFKTSDSLKESISRSSFDDLLEHKLDLMRGDVSNKVVLKFLKENLAQIAQVAEPMEYAVDAIRDFRERGDRIVLITARGEKYFPGTESISKKALLDAGIAYDEIIFDGVNKKEQCASRGVEVFVDDSPINCEEVASVGIPVIGFNAGLTGSEFDARGIKKVDNWKDLVEAIDGLRVD